MKLKTCRQIKSLKGKKVLLRLDLNVPLEGLKVKETYKLEKSLKTINYLQTKGAIVVIVSHLGRPKGKKEMKYSLKPVVQSLEDLSGLKIKFSSQTIGNKVLKQINSLTSGEVILLENLRFHSEEKENNLEFAKSLASLADIYINDAFAVSHREHASVAAIKKYLPSYTGFLLEEEINNLNYIFKPQKPLLAVMGGAKVSSKLKLLESLSKSANKILVGGVLANTLCVAKGLKVGKSLVDSDSLVKAEKFIKKKTIKSKIVLPIDFIVETNKGEVAVRKNKDINKTDKIYDIGPETIFLFAQEIKQAKTLIWNGPLGMFEDKRFKQGTMSIARSLALQSKESAWCVVGGGETVESFNTLNYRKYINWISTGGGAMLSFLAKEDMPGLKGLIK